MNGKLGTEGNSFHFKQTILDVKTQTANKYTIRLFIIVKNLFTLTRGQWKTKWNTNKSFFFFFLVKMENTRTGLCHYASNCFICFQKGMHLQHRLQTASSERAMHILSNKKGHCIHYTISICVSSKLNALYRSGHLVYWMISLQDTTCFQRIFKAGFA